ncbi:hypothetical protein L2E82_53744 [Cichorium intybus]|nr:hypothetical protein L2E82_53744 [Cichorium intybus]
MSLLDFPVEIREKSIQFLMEMEFCEFSPELEDHFEIFEHIRGFNVTIVTSANTQDETLPPWSGFFQKDEGESHRFNGLGLHILYLKKRVKLEGFSSEGQVRSGFPVWFLRKQISISEFRRTIYNPGLAEINEFSWFPPANRASSVMESPGRTTGKDYGRGQTNPGTPQVDTVGVADPIETKTKPEADPDAYLGGAASLRVACHPFSPFSLLRSPRRLSGRAAPSSEVPEGHDKGAGWSGALGRRGPEMDLDDGKSGLPRLLQCLVVRLAAAEAIDLARDAPKCADAITPKKPTLAVRVKSDRNQVQEDRGGLGVIEQGRKKGRSFGSSSAKVDFFQCSSSLQMAYGGIPKPPELLPVPVSLNRSGYPRIIPLIAG